MHEIVRRTLVSAIAFAIAGCSGGDRRDRILQNKGSDTMVNVAQAWAEAYRDVNPNVAIAVSGGGTGTGIAALINGTVDIANASRDIHDDERDQIKQARGVDVREHTIAIDAVAFYVHQQNPLEQVTLEQLACVFGEGGTCTTWSSLGVEVPGCSDQTIIRVSRQSNSGTYEYVRERVLGEGRDFKLGSRDMQGSKDVVDLVMHTPCALGYSGLGYATAGVKTLCIAERAGEPCVTPTIETAKTRMYPLSRPLYMYTLGEPQGNARAYIEWIRSADGQELVARSGFIPIQ
jgi:phosphate transport system substrate-binding protein